MPKYNQIMNQYSDIYYCRKSTDGVSVLVNHAAWCALKGKVHDEEKIHVESYSLDGNKLLLTMIDGTATKLNLRANKVRKLGVRPDVSAADDGGFVVFDAGDLSVIADVFKIKRRQVVTEAMRESGRKLYQQHLGEAD